MADPSPPRFGLRLLIPAAALGVLIALAVVGVRFSHRALALLRGEEPRTPPKAQPARWVAQAPLATAAPADTKAEPEVEAVPPPSPSPAAEAPRAATPPFAIDLAQPLRIEWPLDVGPDISPDRQDERLCLRCRQGANELLTTGDGSAGYAFRLAGEVNGRAWFRMRYASDGIGNVQCNNSLTVRFDGQQPTILGNDNVRTHWAWSRGPAVRLGPGVHWVHIAMREDGPLLDRMVLLPDPDSHRPKGLDDVAVTTFGGLVGERRPAEPQRPIQEVELFALPTASLAVGAGHVNEVTVCASWQGRSGPGFEGTLAIHCATAPGLTAKGQRDIACGPGAPFARRVVELEFPPDAPRRSHKVLVSVADKGGQVVFRGEMRFLKAYAWAFLGPFRDTAGQTAATRLATGDVVNRRLPCEGSPLLLAHLADAQRLGLAGVPLANGRPQADWKLVADGSCCDWTGSVDLQKVYGPTEDAFAYAVTWLRSDRAISRRLLSLQADDAAWLWVNGCFLVQLPTELPREANRLWTSGPLRHGANPVVLKLTQAKGYWGFTFDIVDWHWQGRKGEWDRISGLDPAEWPRR